MGFGNCRRLRIAVLAIVLSAGGSAWGQFDPPELPPLPPGGDLNDQYVESIRQRIVYWAGEMDKAQDVGTLVTVRTRLENDYLLYEGRGYRYVFARESAGVFGDKLHAKGELGPFVQINAALALSSMPQASIQPALEKMVVHPNPAIRYLGWQGYAEARTPILAQYDTNRQTFYKSIRAAAGDEESGLVTRALLRAIQMPPVKPPTWTEQVYADSAKASVSAGRVLWPQLCAQARHGSEKTTALRSMRDGLTVWRNILAINNDKVADKALKSQALQSLVDAMYVAAQLYQVGEATDVSEKLKTVLMSEAEEIANLASETTKNHLRGVLNDTTITDAERRPKVALRVFNWIEDLKKAGFDVVKPEFPAPTTAPATTPAN